MTSVRRLFTVGFGATDGGEVRIHLWNLTEGTVVEVLREKVPMVFGPTGLIWWPKQWIFDFATRVKTMVESGDACGLYGWGADIAALQFPPNGNVPELIAVPHYAGILPQERYQDLIKSVPPLVWHQAFQGANQAAFQPLAQLAVLRDNFPEVLDGGVEFMPVTDLLFTLISGERGHDSTMAQSQGLLFGPGAEGIFSEHFGPQVMRRICRQGFFDLDKVVFDAKKGCYWVPGTHDSPLARAVGFVKLNGKWVLVWWTGSWHGVAKCVEGSSVQPCQQTLELGLSFEGLNPRTVQKNTGRVGPAYKLLLQQASLSYAQGAEMAAAWSGAVCDNLDGELITNKEVKVAVAHILDRCGGNAELAIVSTIHHVAEQLIADSDRVCRLFGESPEMVGIVGGWANNRALRQLAEERGLEVVIPPHAADATEAGLASEMLRRISVFDGESLTLEEALQRLPNRG